MKLTSLRSSAGPALIATLAVFVLSGCGSLIPPATPDTTRHFVLNAAVAKAPEETERSATAKKLTLGLRAVALPDYLRARKNLVVRVGPNEIRYLDDARWAEPLDAGVNRVLQERLAASPRVRAVTAHPLRGDMQRDYDIAVCVLSCEGADGAARFTATYELMPNDGSGKALVSKTFEAPVKSWDGRNVEVLTRQLSEAVVALAESIAADLPE